MDDKIAFLEVLVENKGTVVITSVFRKRTHTDHALSELQVPPPSQSEERDHQVSKEQGRESLSRFKAQG